MITKYGYDVFFALTGIYLVILIFTLFFVEPKGIRYGVIGATVVLFGLTLNFFRDPDRRPPPGDHLILAPADGKIIKVQKVREPEFLKSDATMISIFMSPLNVHVNRNPVTGIVRHYRYVEGEFFAAFEDKASEKNEQTIIGIESSGGAVLMKQIAGFVARRIVCTLNPGDTVRAGERFGMIRFGSRVDVFIPLSAQVLATEGMKAVAGETVLASFRKP